MKQMGLWGSKVPSFVVFSQPASYKALVKIIIMGELPFRFLEHRGFIGFMIISQTHFAMPYRQTLAKDCWLLNENERIK